MKKRGKIKMSIIIVFSRFIFISFVLITFTTCKKDKNEVDCHALVRENPGYEVWAGDSAYFQIANHQDYFYNIDKYGYTLIGSSTTTKTFNTGNHKYYVIVAKYYACVDAIKFKDNSYLGDNSGLYTGGFTEWEKIKGVPDGIFGKFGLKENCIGSNSNNGFITDDKTILSRGGELTVIVGNNDCQ